MHMPEQHQLRALTWAIERFLLSAAIFIMTVGGPVSEPAVAEGLGHVPVPTVGDRLWVWGNPEMGTEGTHDLATFAQAGPRERSALLGVPNVVVAGLGLPNDDAQARDVLKQVEAAPRTVIEIAPDGDDPPFVYAETIARVRRLAHEFPGIEGVLLDDMSTVSIDKGFLPGHIGQIRALLGEDHQRIPIWGVLYTMNLDRPGIEKYIQEIDVINLWTWHARDLVHLEDNVARCERLFPSKPIVLGLYLHDYGESRSIPQELLEQQCTVALNLLRMNRIQGVVFLTIDNEPEALAWTADWIAQVRDEPIADGGEASSKFENVQLDDGSAWDFSGEAWTEDAEGLIRPPDQMNLHSRAVRTDRAYGEFIAEFEFNGDYRETGTGSAGFVFGATDLNRFLCVWFPWGGQQLRAKHFWVGLATVDGDGYFRNLAMEWVPGVPSETDRWYRVRIEAENSNVTVWVDGRKALSVNSVEFADGCVGLEGYGWYAFRNIRIQGSTVSPPPWDETARVPVHSFPLTLTSEKMPTACVAPNGDVLLAAGSSLIRSRDKGRTWSQPETLPEKLGELTDYGSTMFCSPRSRLMIQIYRPQEEGKPVPDIAIAESTDNGLTWSDPVPSQVAPDWPAQPAKLTPYGPLVETTDGGTLLRFLLGRVIEEGDTFTDVITWSSIHCKALAIRSSDGGSSWSAPVEIDQPSWVGKPRGTIPGSLDLTEPTGVAIGNKVMVLVRPIYSPMMWQCWSNDSGATWDAAARATFPGYAQSMVRTASGAILCAHRYPHYIVNISRDDGLNWDAGTVIDYPVWAMGCALEVEPDVVLFTYMNAQQSMPLLAQLVRVTKTGIVPEENRD